MGFPLYPYKVTSYRFLSHCGKIWSLQYDFLQGVEWKSRKNEHSRFQTRLPPQWAEVLSAPPLLCKPARSCVLPPFPHAHWRGTSNHTSAARSELVIMPGHGSNVQLSLLPSTCPNPASSVSPPCLKQQNLKGLSWASGYAPTPKSGPWQKNNKSKQRVEGTHG